MNTAQGGIRLHVAKSTDASDVTQDSYTFESLRHSIAMYTTQRISTRADCCHFSGVNLYDIRSVSIRRSQTPFGKVSMDQVAGNISMLK